MMKLQFLKSHLKAVSGYGEHARDHVAALLLNHFQLTAINDQNGRLFIPGVSISQKMDATIPIVYICGQHNLYTIPPHQPAIISTMIETHRLHPKWFAKLNKADAVWVPSTFNFNSFCEAGIPQEKLHIVKAPINSEAFTNISEKYPYKTKKRYKFLSIFSKVTWYRKGMDVLLEAYLKAFSNKDDVCLILKTGLTMQELLHYTRQTLTPHSPAIEIIDSHLSDAHMLTLYNAANAYVMPSRGEGAGRPYLYALLNQMPTIGTNWSGNTQFMNSNNSFLVDYQLREVPRDLEKIVFPMNFGSHYAEPHLDDLIDKMKYVYHHEAEARQKGKQGRLDVIQHHSYPAIASQTIAALQQFKPSVTQAERQLLPHELFLHMYPLYFPHQHSDLELLDKEFSTRPITSIAIYGTGAGAKSAYKWVSQFKHIKKIVFIDRKKDKPRFMNRKVEYYGALKHLSVELVLIGTAPVFAPAILETLKKETHVPIYEFAP